ncbi:hypothetical protein [Jannaschia ovalis]|uniref:Uncharacterized protein n=1 Tax=Jannaschia ovalis TaxID=3038773 RepID=A0ABY8LJR5_9RHOB|nr:hypothetical protein [Jannaschia sp. GRR-S6-38]WGH80444.1 hypothetical protein P8627_01445 [Jannaschia sp. GRR-S6-38]
MRRFIEDEAGAVTVDWTVLTAGLVGLGLATMSVVSRGVQDASSDIDASLRGIQIVTAFDTVLGAFDFSNGSRGDWVGGDIVNIPGFGEVLALSGDSAAAELALTVGQEHAYAEIEFDMIMGDSWDGEAGAITINGETVVLGSQNHLVSGADVQTFDGPEGSTVSILRENVTSGTGSPGWTSQQDYTYRVRITQANDGSPIQLGAATTLQQGATDEFFGIDNVEVRGVARP